MPKCPACRCDNPEGTPICRECGTNLPMPPAGEPVSDASGDADLVALVRDGNKIEAVKLYRERHGVGLKEAKDAVEALEEGRQPAAPPAPAEDGDVLELLQAKRKIDAIKIYRERHGVGLKEAKDAVEALARQHGISQGAGCAGVVLIGLVGLAAGAWCLLA